MLYRIIDVYGSVMNIFSLFNLSNERLDDIAESHFGYNGTVDIEERSEDIITCSFIRCEN